MTIDTAQLAVRRFIFEKSENNIKFTYYHCSQEKFIERDIDTVGLKEIRIEGTFHPGYKDVPSSWSYCVRALYDYKDIGKKDYIVAQ